MGVGRKGNDWLSPPSAQAPTFSHCILSVILKTEIIIPIFQRKDLVQVSEVICSE